MCLVPRGDRGAFGNGDRSDSEIRRRLDPLLSKVGLHEVPQSRRLIHARQNQRGLDPQRVNMRLARFDYPIEPRLCSLCIVAILRALPFYPALYFRDRDDAGGEIGRLDRPQPLKNGWVLPLLPKRT